MKKACINCKNFKKISQIGGNCLISNFYVVNQHGELKEKFKKVFKFDKCSKFEGKDLPNKTVNTEID
jgi:hypothetical protein